MKSSFPPLTFKSHVFHPKLDLTYTAVVDYWLLNQKQYISSLSISIMHTIRYISVVSKQQAARCYTDWNLQVSSRHCQDSHKCTSSYLPSWYDFPWHEIQVCLSLFKWYSKNFIKRSIMSLRFCSSSWQRFNCSIIDSGFSGPGSFISRPACFPLGFSTDPDHINTIRKFPPQKRCVTHFSSTRNFYHNFIPYFVDVTSTLNALKKGVKYVRGKRSKGRF